MTERGTMLGGRYELDQVIGRGGMAEVWKARDSRLGRDVAIKQLRVDLASDSTFQARFRREAQAAAGLNHPNIVSVYDTGEEVDPLSEVHIPYIVMELVEGVTLREVLRGGRKILPERALEFTQGVLDALAYSHRAGIVHRDIKPANVMLTASGAVKVMDFGIARAVADTSATMTQTAAVIGTAQYLSPEQARGEKVDNRSDIYSTGVLLYELLVGRPPFIGDSPVSVAYQHVREIPVPPSALDAEISPAMDAIVLKALAKDPAGRYQDARAMREDISRCLNNAPVAAAMQPTMVATPPADVATAVVPRVQQEEPPAASPAVQPPEPNKSPKKRKRSVASIVLGSAIALLVVVVAVAAYVITRPTTPSVIMKPVPSVVGYPVEQAKSTLINAEFQPVVDTAQSERPKDEVISQKPGPKTEAPQNSTVTITVSLGPSEKSLPDLRGKTVDEAKALLKQAGITTDPVQKQADPKTEPIDATAGTVVSFDPHSGSKIDAKTKVTLTIATGKSIVPNLSGKDQDGAVKLARSSGFAIKWVAESSNTTPGIAFKQSPADGTAEFRSTVITVYYAEKPTPPTTPPTTAPPTTPTAPPTTPPTKPGP